MLVETSGGPPPRRFGQGPKKLASDVSRLLTTSAVRGCRLRPAPAQSTRCHPSSPTSKKSNQPGSQLASQLASQHVRHITAGRHQPCFSSGRPAYSP
ncbi:hypothetical protein GGTG_01841 [Gaeumannomyces tritici R3-111a-1]|uniref:Uncharacterized protein n=1 Tax=Gaeumannomyces tritici (strain R3-111a-1) TaxID=644352 RepID=J3NKQ0_GAET3|nr:hypothetical protein GGTG_01841 [Gaeumannomyces tritici R3-111a-1]EJT81867.1 hypothetical protein GGTG_01841 [Gaeumannomyces tritici R3-111a-1]